MILSFKTEIGGKATNFPTKIRLCLGIKKSELKIKCKPKLHTIREDKKNRWKERSRIDFYTGIRSKKSCRFAPSVFVKSVQEIRIEWVTDTEVLVWIDGTAINGHKVQELAINDGFDTVEDFFAWFNADFKGKIIHFSDLKY